MYIKYSQYQDMFKCTLIWMFVSFLNQGNGYSICPTTLKISAHYSANKHWQITLNVLYYDCFTHILYLYSNGHCHEKDFRFNISCPQRQTQNTPNYDHWSKWTSILDRLFGPLVLIHECFWNTIIPFSPSATYEGWENKSRKCSTTSPKISPN